MSRLDAIQDCIDDISRRLDALEVKGRSDAFSEGDHPRDEGGQFTVTKTAHYLGEGASHKISGTRSNPNPKMVPAQAFNVHHGEKHLGKVNTATGAEVKRMGPRNMSTGRTLLKWMTNPTQEEGKPHRRGETATSKKEAIRYLIQSHELKPPEEFY